MGFSSCCLIQEVQMTKELIRRMSNTKEDTPPEDKIHMIDTHTTAQKQRKKVEGSYYVVSWGWRGRLQGWREMEKTYIERVQLHWQEGAENRKDRLVLNQENGPGRSHYDEEGV